MDAQEIALRRLHAQRLATNGLTTPQEAVAWLGAVQAQEFGMAKWGLGLRMQNATEAMLEDAFSRGEILRTHVMRPTWHFVAPADVRWLLSLSGPRVLAKMAGRYRGLELSEETFRRSRALFTAALAGGQALTRDELHARLEAGGISAAGQRMPHLLMHAELNALLVSGPRKGKQHTFMLLEERVPTAPILAREEAIGALTWRYFRGHGPATVKDFCWWSGLKAADARAGIAMNQGRLFNEMVAKQAYWFADGRLPAPAGTPQALLVPTFDELTVGYVERSAYLARLGQLPPDPYELGTLQNLVLVDGQIAGVWARVERKTRLEVSLTRLLDLNAAERKAVEGAIQRFGAFSGLPAAWVA